MKPQRTFIGSEGDYSVDNKGPEAIKEDIDSIMRMFDPTATHPNNEKGGISVDNLNEDFTNTLEVEDEQGEKFSLKTAIKNIYEKLKGKADKNNPTFTGTHANFATEQAVFVGENILLKSYQDDDILQGRISLTRTMDSAWDETDVPNVEKVEAMMFVKADKNKPKFTGDVSFNNCESVFALAPLHKNFKFSASVNGVNHDVEFTSNGIVIDRRLIYGFDEDGQPRLRLVGGTRSGLTDDDILVAGEVTNGIQSAISNIVIPTKTSELTNDSDFTTNEALTNLSNQTALSLSDKAESYMPTFTGESATFANNQEVSIGEQVTLKTEKVGSNREGLIELRKSLTSTWTDDHVPNIRKVNALIDSKIPEGGGNSFPTGIEIGSADITTMSGSDLTLEAANGVIVKKPDGLGGGNIYVGVSDNTVQLNDFDRVMVNSNNLPIFMIVNDGNIKFINVKCSVSTNKNVDDSWGNKEFVTLEKVRDMIQNGG